MMPDRGHCIPSVANFSNFVFPGSIFQANFADRFSAPDSLFSTATISPGCSLPFTRHDPINSGEALECSGNCSTSRTIDFLSRINRYSFPQMSHDDKNRSPASSDPPKSLRPKALCLASTAASLSFVMNPPINALGISAPHRTLLNKSAADTFGDELLFPASIDKLMSTSINNVRTFIYISSSANEHSSLSNSCDVGVLPF